MDKIYYLFSPAKRTEALFLCRGSNFIDKPYIKSAVYPMGVIFSKAMKTITPVINATSAFLSLDELLEGVADFSKEDSSFSSIACKDESLRMIFNALLGNNREKYDKPDGIKAINTLIRINDYLSLCSDDKYLESIPNYHRQLSVIGVKLPSYIIFNGNSDNGKNGNSKGSKVFSPPLSGRTRPLFGNAPNTAMPEQFGKLMLPLYVYEIDYISDLLTSAIQQIFENNHSITKCRFCENYFVAKNKRNKYCPTVDYKSEKETCYYIAHKSRVKGLCDDEIQRTYNSVRNMLMRKCNLDLQDNGENTQRYKDFKQKRKEYLKAIKLGKATADEYYDWLKSHFVYKYKK